MQYFTTQLSSYHQGTQNLRENQYRPAKKRRRSGHQDGSSDSEAEAQTASKTRTHFGASHAFPNISQLRVAGLLPEDGYKIPASPFPHAPISTVDENLTGLQIEEDIAAPPARLYAVNALSKGESLNKSSGITSLRKSHLEILSTVLHRCLLEQDYGRAGRAWGMLLRTFASGRVPIDLRNHGRWGIGAEILLRRKPGATANNTAGLQSEQESLNPDVFSERGFEWARDYYERLILQYPYRKISPHALDERSFYPAMFSLWIFEVCEKSKRTREKAQEITGRSRSRSMSVGGPLSDISSIVAVDEDSILAEELARAREIAARLDQLVASPPFDKQASLLQLRGDVALWMSVLLSGKFGDEDDDDDWDMESEDMSSGNHSISVDEKITQISDSIRELRMAEKFFERAETNGASRRTATLVSIGIKLKELFKKQTNLITRQEESEDITAL